MKPFLGIDHTTDKKNETPNGAEFLADKPSQMMSNAIERSAENALELFEQARLPLPLRIVQWVCGIVGAVIPLSAIGVLIEGEMDAQQIWNDAGAVFLVVTLACLAVWACLTVASFKKTKGALESEEGDQLFSRMDVLATTVYAQMGVPEDAPTVDVLSFCYKMKDGEPRIVGQALSAAVYENEEYRIFADEENLYLADLEGKYAFPKVSLRGIRTVEKRILLSMWNKDEEHNKGIYKPYKLSVDDEMNVRVRSYHVLEVEKDGEMWGIYFPCYELPTVEAVTGMGAQDPDA